MNANANQLNPPSVSEELRRKAVEEMERLYQAKLDGRMLEVEFNAAISTLYNATSGLIDKSESELIALLFNDGKHEPTEARVLMKRDKLVVVTVKRVGTVVSKIVRRWDDDSAEWSQQVISQDYKEDLSPHKTAKAVYVDTCRQILARGFVEV